MYVAILESQASGIKLNHLWLLDSDEREAVLPDARGHIGVTGAVGFEFAPQCGCYVCTIKPYLGLKVVSQNLLC